MNRLYFQDLEPDQIISLIDQRFEHFIIPNFYPTKYISGEIDIKTELGFDFKGIRVDNLTADFHLNLGQLKELIRNSRYDQISFYQFSKKPSESFVLTSINGNNREKILKQNGMEHFYSIQWRVFYVETNDLDFIHNLKQGGLKSKITLTPHSC